MSYDKYLETLVVVRRRTQMLNAALGDAAPGLLVHEISKGLANSLMDLLDLWEPEYGNYVPRAQEDPMVDEFLDMLIERVHIPDSLGDTHDDSTPG